MANTPCYYSDYLQLDTLLSAQKPISQCHGEQPSHHELFFITAHHAFELWFKQLLHETEALLRIFENPAAVNAKALIEASALLKRYNVVVSSLIGQVSLLEGLTPKQFLEFRDQLTPASGFQSVQFRLVELKLGVKRPLDKIIATLKPADQERLHAAQASPSLFDRINAWLAHEYKHNKALRNNMTDYQKRAEQYFHAQEAEDTVNDDVDNIKSRQRQSMRAQFASLFEVSAEKHEANAYALSHDAMLAALSIYLQGAGEAYTLIHQLMKTDELWARWRYEHALMVERMIGHKVGTGGSSGFEYLMKTTQYTRVFEDLTQLSTYLLPLDLAL